MREAVGSSPSVSTTSLRTAYRSQRLFCKSHFSLILSQLLSESNPLSLGFDSVFYFDWGIFFCQCFPRRRGLRIIRDGVFLFKANAVSHSLRRSSFPRKAAGFAGTPNTGCPSPAACIFAKAAGARTPQLLSESNPLSLGFDSVLYFDWGIFFCQCFPRRRGLRIIRDGVFLFKANAVSHSLRRSSFPRKAAGFAGTPNTGCPSPAACIFAKAAGARIPLRLLF